MIVSDFRTITVLIKSEQISVYYCIGVCDAFLVFSEKVYVYCKVCFWFNIGYARICPFLNSFLTHAHHS